MNAFSLDDLPAVSEVQMREVDRLMIDLFDRGPVFTRRHYEILRGIVRDRQTLVEQQIRPRFQRSLIQSAKVVMLWKPATVNRSPVRHPVQFTNCAH